jgi:hypothetical protein
MVILALLSWQSVHPELVEGRSPFMVRQAHHEREALHALNHSVQHAL